MMYINIQNIRGRQLSAVASSLSNILTIIIITQTIIIIGVLPVWKKYWILSMFINVKIDGLDHLRSRGQDLGRGILLPSISSFASHFLSSPEKLSKHSTDQFFFSFLNVGEALSNAQRSRQLRHGPTTNPRRCPRGWESWREHSHLTDPDIRHILFSTCSLPHFAACLHSNPCQQDWIQLAAGHWHRPATSLDRRFCIGFWKFNIIK